MVAVPRSGWTRIRAQGTPISSAAGQIARHWRIVAGGQQLVEAGQHQHDRRLHELGRLQPDEAEVEPALRALADEAERLDHDQHEQDDAVDREGELP